MAFIFPFSPVPFLFFALMLCLLLFLFMFPIDRLVWHGMVCFGCISRGLLFFFSSNSFVSSLFYVTVSCPVSTVPGHNFYPQRSRLPPNDTNCPVTRPPLYPSPKITQVEHLLQRCPLGLRVTERNC